jgi:hypothetical protein
MKLCRVYHRYGKPTDQSVRFLQYIFNILPHFYPNACAIRQPKSEIGSHHRPGPFFAPGVAEGYTTMRKQNTLCTSEIVFKVILNGLVLDIFIEK